MQTISRSQAANTFGVGRLIRPLLEILVASFLAQRGNEIASAYAVIVWAWEQELLVVPVLFSLDAGEGIQSEFSVNSFGFRCRG